VLEQLTATTLPVLVDVGSGILVPALTAELQLSLLAVRGASEAWHRLDRLAALAALASKLFAPALEAAVERSVRLETERPLAAGLVLAHRLFGTRLPSELWVDGGAARLVRIGLGELGAPKPTLYRSSLSRALLKPGSRFFLGSLFRQLGRALLL
jgi:hypothetical protein